PPLAPLRSPRVPRRLRLGSSVSRSASYASPWYRTRACRRTPAAQLTRAGALPSNPRVLRSSRDLRRCRLAAPCAPVALDLSESWRVHDQVAERPDRAHVAPAEEAVRLHEDGHLAAVAARVVLDPADVHEPVHRLVGDL